MLYYQFILFKHLNLKYTCMEQSINFNFLFQNMSLYFNCVSSCVWKEPYQSCTFWVKKALARILCRSRFRPESRWVFWSEKVRQCADLRSSLRASTPTGEFGCPKGHVRFSWSGVSLAYAGKRHGCWMTHSVLNTINLRSTCFSYSSRHLYVGKGCLQLSACVT